MFFTARKKAHRKDFTSNNFSACKVIECTNELLEYIDSSVFKIIRSCSIGPEE